MPTFEILNIEYNTKTPDGVDHRAELTETDIPATMLVECDDPDDILGVIEESTGWLVARYTWRDQDGELHTQDCGFDVQADPRAYGDG